MKEILERIQQEFSSARGPALYRFSKKVFPYKAFEKILAQEKLIKVSE